MRVHRTKAEVEQIKKYLSENSTFYKCYTTDFTEEVIEDLRYKLYGRIPRNFLINISGLIGSATGIFKSTMGLQIALRLDPFFNLKQRVAFSINNLLDKIERYSEYSLCPKCYMLFQKQYKGTYEMIQEEQGETRCENCDNIAQITILLTKLIFFLDEQTKTLRVGGLTRLQNIIDTVRQRQICFITCGVDTYDMNFSTYQLQRIQESSDKFLPKKRVRYAVYDDRRDIYYGYFNWDITPLTDIRWKTVWTDYSKMKQDFQRVAISQKITSMRFEEYAEEVMTDMDYPKVWKQTKRGTVIDKPLLESLIFKKFPDLTNQQRNYILQEIRLMTKETNGDEPESQMII